MGHLPAVCRLKTSGRNSPNTPTNDSGKCFYVAACSIREKKIIAKKDRLSQGPDILVEEADQKIWIEAVTPTAGQPGKLDTVPGLHADGEVHAVPDDSLLLRFLHAMEEKRRKFCSYLDDHIVDPNDLCIIAVNGGDQKGSGGFDSVFELAVYPNRIKTLGDEFWKWDACYPLRKSNNASVQAGVFVTAEYKDIIGTIFSPSTIGNLVDSVIEIQYFPNPNSIRRITVNWVPWSKEYVIRKSSSQMIISKMENRLETAKMLGPFPAQIS